jgi:hypothetical protein
VSIPILENGAFIVDEQFLKDGPHTTVRGQSLGQLSCSTVIDIQQIVEPLNDLAVTESRVAPSSDGPMAVHLHRAIRINRAEAVRREFWHYLCVMKCAPYVHWRWFSPQLGMVRVTRYLGPWYLNALGRLWWWAELSYADGENGPDYEPTVVGAQNQELMRDMIENLLSGNRQLVNSLVAHACAGRQALNDDGIREVVKRLNMLLATTRLDALGDVDAVVATVVSDVRSMSGLVATPAVRKRRLLGLFGGS